MTKTRMTRRVLLVGLALWLGLAGPLAALTAARVTVASTATLVSTGSTTGGSSVLIRNAGAASVYLGAVAVTTATGFELPAGDAITVPLGPSEPVYGIVTTGTVVVHKLEIQR
jgi:hypothetical protein